MNVLVSILHYNDPKDTIMCLDSLLKLDFSDVKITTYVLDNGSKISLNVDVARYKKINLKVIVSKINTGFTGGHNVVYEKSKHESYDYFLLLNNDCILSPHSVTKLLQPLRDEKVGAVVPKIYFTSGHEYHKDRYRKEELGKVFWYAGGRVDWDNIQSKHIGVDEVDRGQYDEEKSIDFATGACLLIKRNVLQKIGLFDERYFLYFEDADLSQRVQRAGYVIKYVPSSIVWHDNSASSGSGSNLHDYYLTRNRMLFGMKFAPIRSKIALLRESLRLLASGREWQRKGIRDYYLGKFGKGSY